MRLHLVPKILNKYADVTAELVRIDIPEIGLILEGDKDVVTRRPYPNKQYQVACRKKGSKAITGIFVEVDEHLSHFTVETLWNLKGPGRELNALVHRVLYTVADRDFGAISDDHVLLHGRDNFKPRAIGRIEADRPVDSQPRMDVIFDHGEHGRGVIADITDKYLSSGVLVERDERITVPTIEVERFDSMSMFSDRMPDAADAFRVSPVDE